MEASLFVAVAVGGVGVSLVGWMRVARYFTERRVIEAIYTRKTKPAEDERGIAVRNLKAAKDAANSSRRSRRSSSEAAWSSPS